MRLKDLRPCIEEIPIRSAIANNVVHGTTYENSIHKFSDLDGQKGHGVAIMVDCFVTSTGVSMSDMVMSKDA